MLVNTQSIFKNNPKARTCREAKYIKMSACKIADETKDRFGKDLSLFESIGEMLRENGFDTEFEAKLKGTSGVQHLFDIIAKEDGFSWWLMFGARGRMILYRFRLTGGYKKFLTPLLRSSISFFRHFLSK